MTVMSTTGIIVADSLRLKGFSLSQSVKPAGFDREFGLWMMRSVDDSSGNIGLTSERDRGDLPSSEPLDPGLSVIEPFLCSIHLRFDRIELKGATHRDSNYAKAVADFACKHFITGEGSVLIEGVDVESARAFDFSISSSGTSTTEGCIADKLLHPGLSETYLSSDDVAVREQQAILNPVCPLPVLCSLVNAEVGRSIPLSTAVCRDSSPADQIMSSLSTAYEHHRWDQFYPTELSVLRIRIMPKELGEVDVILRRSGGEVRVHILVACSITAEALRHDTNFLEDRLGSLSFAKSAHTVSVEIRGDSAVLNPDNYWADDNGHLSCGTQTETDDQRSTRNKEERAFFSRAEECPDEKNLSVCSDPISRIRYDLVV